jgi:hypothetical protein
MLMLYALWTVCPAECDDDCGQDNNGVLCGTCTNVLTHYLSSGSACESE